MPTRTAAPPSPRAPAEPLRPDVRREDDNGRERSESVEKKVEPLELFLDLVFVFALTQVTARLADDPTWGGLLRGLLVLAAI